MKVFICYMNQNRLDPKETGMLNTRGHLVIVPAAGWNVLLKGDLRKGNTEKSVKDRSRTERKD